jgi:hypothetical protein
MGRHAVRAKRFRSQHQATMSLTACLNARHPLGARREKSLLHTETNRGMGECMKILFIALLCASTLLFAENALAAIKFKLFAHCGDGLVTVHTCECHAQQFAGLALLSCRILLPYVRWQLPKVVAAMPAHCGPVVV